MKFQNVITRLAPSPSGRMHLGNVWASLAAWLGARSAGGRVLLRLEDLDPQRCTRAYAAQVIEDFQWLGLDWDNTPVYQSQRTEFYHAAFSKLEQMELIYPCFCSRAARLAASAPHESDGEMVYGGTCRAHSDAQRELLAQRKTPAFRVCVPAHEISFFDLVQGAYTQNLARDCGDFILRRADGVYAYQLAVVVDDGMMGVNLVVRGADLLSSTPRQIWLCQQLEVPFMRYAHVPLLRNQTGVRLAKRDKSQSLQALKAQYTPAQIVGKLAFEMGLIPQYAPMMPRDLLPFFSWDAIKKQDVQIKT